MSHHIRLYNAGGDFPSLPPLRLEGDFPLYTSSGDYRGTIDIIDAVGRCTVRVLESNLPQGYRVFVDNFNNKVVLTFGAPPAPETRSGLPNGDFEDGEEGWDLKNGWAVETVDRDGDASNQALVYRGPGSSKITSARFPIEGESYNQFEGLWNQGPSNKANVDLYTNLVVTDADGTFVTRFMGSKVHDMSNKSWHVSEGTGRPPKRDDLFGQVELEVFRRNSRSRPVYVDNVEWNITYVVPAPEGDYTLSLEVTDSAGRKAYWIGSITESAVIVTSKLYPLLIVESFYDGGFSSVGYRDDIFEVESFGMQGAALLSAVLRDPLTALDMGSDSFAMAGASLVSGRFSGSVVPANAGFDSFRMGSAYLISGSGLRDLIIPLTSDVASFRMGGASLISGTLT